MSKKTSITENNKEGGGMLPKMEFLIIFIFFLSFIVWAMSKCNNTREAYQKAAAKEQKVVEKKTKPEVIVKKTPQESKINEVTTQSPPKVIREKVTVLYVTLEGLNVRKGPHLDSTIVKTLKRGSEVNFLNEVTNFKQKINLGDRIAVEPWVKIRTYSGHEGWVYGAGVNYFKGTPILDTLGR